MPGLARRGTREIFQSRPQALGGCCTGAGVNNEENTLVPTTRSMTLPGNEDNEGDVPWPVTRRKMHQV